MRHRPSWLIISAAIVVGLTSCAPSPETDWDAAQSEANAFVESAEASAGFLGSATLRAERNAHAPQDENELTLTYPSTIRIEGLSTACFGGGEATVGVAVRTTSSWAGAEAITLTCDSEARTMPLAAPLEHVNAIMLSGGIDKGSGAVVAVVVTGVAE